MNFLLLFLHSQLLFLSDAAVNENISGVILFHETLYQKAADGTPFAEILKNRGILPGIKVDKGVVDLFGSEDECTTQGIDSVTQTSSTPFILAKLQMENPK